MTRGLTSGMLAEVAKSRFVPRNLVHFALDSGPIRLCDDIRDIVFSGDTFTGAGGLGSISPIKETADLRANGVEFLLSGIDNTWVGEATSQNTQGRTVEIWKAFLDVSTHALIADPIKHFSGRIDQMVITDAGETTAVKVTAESRLVDLVRPLNVRYITDQDQQNEFTGDLGHEFVTLMQEVFIVWGRTKLERGIVTPPPGGSDAATPTPATAPVDVGGAGGADPNSGSLGQDFAEGQGGSVSI